VYRIVENIIFGSQKTMLLSIGNLSNGIELNFNFNKKLPEKPPRS
jgi:hypothetical protein